MKCVPAVLTACTVKESKLAANYMALKSNILIGAKKQMPIKHSKMPTWPDVEIFYIAEGESGITGQYLSATKAGVSITIDQAVLYTIAEQDKEIALSRLIMIGLYDPETDSPPWEMKNDMVNLIVPSQFTQRVTRLVAGLSVTVNG